MKHADALKIALYLVARLAPVCERIEIAGSVRRRKPEVKDIEIVAIPDLSPVPVPKPMFGKPRLGWHKTKLDALLFEICKEGWMRPEKFGDRYKKFDVAVKHFIEMGLPQIISLDLFLVLPPAQWGVQSVIRTGPAEFSHWMVTRKSMGGALPDDFIVQDGVVGKRVKGIKGFEREGEIEMPEEVDFFKLCELEWIEPGKREAKWSLT